MVDAEAVCGSLGVLRLYMDADMYARVIRALRERKTGELLYMIGEILEKTRIKQFYRPVKKEKTIVHHLSKLLLYMSTSIETPPCIDDGGGKTISNAKQKLIYGENIGKK